MRRLVLLFAATVVAIASSSAIAKTMTAEQISAELLGKSLCVRGNTGGQICVRHSKNGTSKVLSGIEPQTGKWHFKGNQHCVTWQKIRGGKEACATFDKTGNTYSHSLSGKITVK